jgi:hypothetical protein
VDEASRRTDLARQLGEALAGGLVTIDADQRPPRPDTLGDEPRVTATAGRAVDGDVARLRIESVDQLAGEHGHVRDRHVKQCCQVPA